MAVFVLDRNGKALMPCSEKRATGSFNIQTGSAVVQGISHRYCRLIQRGDGYGYTFSACSINTIENRLPHPAEAVGCPAVEKL